MLPRSNQSWATPVLAFLQFLQGPAWASYSGQNNVPHVYYSQASDSGSLGLSATGNNVYLTPPNKPDEALACVEEYQLWTNNSANASADNATYLEGIGVSNVQTDTGCPIWPYIGDHIFGSGPPTINGQFAVFAPAASNLYGNAREQRIDAIMYNGQYGCGGGGAISTISAGGGNETINVASTSGYAVNDFIQVTGASITADNSTPGTAFKIGSLVTNTSITFPNASAATCSSSCGNVAFPYQAGSPPYTVLNGASTINGTSTPAVNALIARAPSGGPTSVVYSVLANMVCSPMVACPYGAGCGLWSSASGNAWQ